MKIEITCRFSGNVLFEHTAEGNTKKITVEAGIKARANLEGANLEGANLEGANLARANLARANLARANLARANLEGANLEGANLEGANLEGAYLDQETELKGERPIFQIGPIGSRCAYFVAYITTKGLLVSAGCFKAKTIAEFRDRLVEEHGGNKHAEEYESALALIEKHAELWG
jgi:hypothetical protein